MASATALAALLLAGCGGNSAAGGEDGQEPRVLSVAAYQGPNASDTVAMQEWADRVKELTGGSIEVEFFFQESLLSATDILAGVGAGSAEMGGMSHGYFPNELPLSTVMNLSFKNHNQPAQMATLQEMYRSDAEFKADWEKNNVVPLLFTIHTATLLGCTEPIDSLEDLQGKDVRASSLDVGDYEAVGANVLTLTAPEIRESVDHGLLDCWSAQTLDSAVDFGLEEVTPYVYHYGNGSNGASELVIGTEVYESLTDEQREAMAIATEEVTASYVDITAARFEEACAALHKAGASLQVLSPEVQDEWRQLAEKRAEDTWLKTAGDRGAEFLDRYLEVQSGFEAKFADYESPVDTCANS